MSERAQALAERFQRANQAATDIIASASDEQLQAICTGEQATVASLAFHVGGVHALAAGWVADIAAGRGLPPVDWDAVNAINAEAFTANASRSRDEVLGVLRQNGAAALQTVHGLSDEDLARSAHFVLFDREMTTADMIEDVLIYDVESHLASIRAAIGG
jgi:hypothetical protein